jgi:hypothetical protein
MEFPDTYRCADARRSRRKPFRLYKRHTLESDTSRGGHRVELIKARRADKYGRDKCYAVIYETWIQGRKGWIPWRKIVTQTPCRRYAQLVFEACLFDEATGYPLETE